MNRISTIILIILFFFKIDVFAQFNLSDSLVAYYNFNGNSLDLSGNDNHGVTSGASLTDDRFNQANSAYSFDGIDDFILAGNIIDISQQSEMTICAWFYLDTIFGRGNRATGIAFGKKETGKLELRVNTESNLSFASLVASGASVSTNSNTTVAWSAGVNYGQWYHVAGTYSDTSIQIFLNGIYAVDYFTGAGIGAYLNSVPSNASLTIGLAYNTNNDERFYHGKMDEVLIYNRKLSPSEINDVYNGAPIINGINSKLDNQITLYPNPSSDNLTIYGLTYTNEDLEVRMTDVNGKLIKTYSINSINNTIQISNLISGLYFIEISSQEKTFWGKFIKE